MRCLLVNSWIYDFAAFDLWIKPLGLLYIGAVLRDHGWNIDLLDCLNRIDPLMKNLRIPKSKKYYTGKYYKTGIPKPDILVDIPRYYSCYGMPEILVRKHLKLLKKPDVILLTSGMTYWYPALIDMVALLKEYFPTTPVILGGIYATLVPDHAKQFVPADFVIEGEAENIIPGFLAEKCNFDYEVKIYKNLDNLPYPALDLYSQLLFLPIATSRGCPFRCTFCASHRISGKYRKRSVDSVVHEIVYWHEKHNISHVVFYDDALLFRKKNHILPVLESLLKQGLKLNFHTPNGLQADAIDRETASLMVQSGFKTICLSLESTAERRKQDISKKVTPEGFVRAVEAFDNAGFARDRIETYILMGLPEQDIEEVIETMYFAANQGVILRLAAFSPIPGTQDWQRAINCGDLYSDADLLETNNSVYITRTKVFSGKTVEKIKNLSKILNTCNKSKLPMPDKNDTIKKIMKSRN